GAMEPGDQMAKRAEKDRGWRGGRRGEETQPEKRTVRVEGRGGGQPRSTRTNDQLAARPLFCKWVTSQSCDVIPAMAASHDAPAMASFIRAMNDAVPRSQSAQRKLQRRPARGLRSASALVSRPGQRTRRSEEHTS